MKRMYMLDADKLLGDIRDIFFSNQTEWLSLEELTADLRRQPYAAYHSIYFHEGTLAKRLRDFDIRTVRRGTKSGYALDDLLKDRIRRYAPGAPRIVRIDWNREENASHE